MTHTYNISGMTCNGCVAKAKSELLKLGDITEADVQLTSPQATITMQKHIPVQELQNALRKAGNYTITEADGGMHHTEAIEDKTSWFATYKPILLICAYITGATLLIEAVRGRFDVHTWMANFMAGFFLVFSFFKLLDLKGFAENYSTYDIIAKRWQGWGYVYAFVELALGIAYLSRFDLLVTNAITFFVMSVSIIGVMQSVMSKRKIRCACLGAVFNLPMSTVAIIEDGLMIAMSLLTVLSLNNTHL
ncbi:heavy metal translocating P-type ATPase [Flavisolibacter ginsenosidimutans]|uniref:Heavy-metal-associated domain-containing protein n=1 Tax=Flavisolibacter ginsenosidimutans TaxID=661481 RepID=A0A5B8UGD7_9BACT|nr:heavy metal-associated domain-containing protein [Flavisolibacter ginsenosidimutans]QEC55707.1 heavy-metal-associated domain-containing protein [Flavisolibacter ginsenosidimutans]